MRLQIRHETPPVVDYFNPRIPYGMRRNSQATHAAQVQFQSTHPVWDATGVEAREAHGVLISIHASRMGCDCHGVPPKRRARIFQSTHPVWDATQHHRRANITGVISIHASRMGCDVIFRAVRNSPMDFNPRIPYGMRPTWLVDYNGDMAFQSTHPVWDATWHNAGMDMYGRQFQSTHPVWDATCRRYC